MIDSTLLPLKDTMHSIASGLLLPTIVVLLLLVVLVIIEAGGALAESIIRTRRSKLNLSELIDGIQLRDADVISMMFNESSLPKRHKTALNELVSYRSLPDASRQALARRLLTTEELHCDKTTNRTDLVSRIGPMFGLMATLIPLGPGMIALGQGDTKTLADSLLTAFDATVSGLAAAGVAFTISKLRKRWYEDDLSALEAIMESLLEVLNHAGRAKDEKSAES